MPTGDGNYITIAAVQADFAVKDKIIKSGFGTTDIAASILEAENFVEGYLAPIGFFRADLVQAPSISRICMLYVRYAIMRDIYTNISPSESDELVFKKWLDAATNKLNDLTSKDNKLQLTDAGGNLIKRSGADNRFKIESNTLQVKRAVSMDNDTTWRIDGKTYAASSVIGEK